MHTTARLASVGVVCALLAAGCGARSVRVAELHGQPYRYDDRAIRIEGVVTSSWGVPMLLHVYNIDDGTGQVAVISRTGSVPPAGARVQVTGRVSQLAAIGGRSIGLHVQEEQRRFRR